LVAVRATAEVWIRRGPLRASLALVLALLAVASCTMHDDDDEEGDDDDDDDVPAASAPERTPPGSVSPSSDASYDSSPQPSPEASSPDAGSGDEGAPSVCASGVPEASAAFCAWRAEGLCFEQAEPACACAGCGLDRCSLVNPTAALDAPLDVVCATPQLWGQPIVSDAGPDA
jgi:hypothetical protein